MDATQPYPPTSAGEGAQARPHRLYTVCGGTDTGSQRNQNQDTFVIADLESGRIERPCISTDVWVARPGVLMLVCDGMGGPAAGDVAAQLAASSIKQRLQAEGDNVGRAPTHSLKRAVLDANKVILDEANAHPEERGMGTTCTAALVSPDRLAIAQVGDSRAYLMRDGRLRPLTRDQTLVADLLAAGARGGGRGERGPGRRGRARARGAKPSVTPVITDVEVREGHRVLLCSFGLLGAVPEPSISAILSGTGMAA